MKKVFVCLMAAAALGFVSCNKNYAEEYEGSYLVNVFTETSMNDRMLYDTVMATPLNIVLDGEEGDVLLKFLGSEDYSSVTLKGTADKKGLHIKGYTDSVATQGGSVTYTFSDATAQMDKDVLTWTQDLNGRVVIPERNMDWSIISKRQYVATKQK